MRVHIMFAKRRFDRLSLPWVPEKGTVGASGDLAPLAHLALGMLGEGRMWSPESGWGEGMPAEHTHTHTAIHR